MSTLSMGIASVEMDPALGDDNDIGNQICVLVTTHGDGTLLGSRSFKEQDVVEVCAGLGQENPKGVLQLLDTEAVLAFWCDTDMMAAMHNLMATKLWWGKPIILHILSLKGRLVREYVAMRNIHLSGT